jgi:hypothetical protein
MRGMFFAMSLLFSMACLQASEQAKCDHVNHSILRQFVIDKQFEVAKEKKVPFGKVSIYVKGRLLTHTEVRRGHNFLEMGAKTEQDIEIVVAH